MIEESIDKLNIITLKLSHIEQSGDLAVLYDILIDYCEFCADVDRKSLIFEKTAGDMDFIAFKECWNLRLSSTCGDLNGILDQIREAFYNITTSLKTSHKAAKNESPHKDRLIEQIEAQISLDSKVISHNRTKFIFILNNSISHHSNLLNQFSLYIEKESVNMW
jgi:hypothetical protein